MAKAISNEELQLRKRARRRLVGAIALVVIVVVFVPMVLENEPKPVSQDISINIAPPAVEADDAAGAASDSGPLRFRPVEKDSGDSAADESPPPAQTAAVERQVQPPASEPAVAEEPARSPASESPASAVEQRFVVQLGAFSNAQNAATLASKVREYRFDVYTEVVNTSGGKRTRVRVGPYPTRAEAEQARESLKARKMTYGEPDIVRLTD